MNEDLLIYSISHPEQKESVAIVYYTLKGELTRADFLHSSASEFKTLVGKFLPLTPDKLEGFRKGKYLVKDISKIDLSFDHFWDVFGYKVGKIPYTKRLWEALTKEEKILALGGIRRYKQFCDQKRQTMHYPSTYLSGRLWESEWPLQ